jgi:hypothetical protein
MNVARTAWDDWYVDGDESAVLVDGNVVVLSVLATALVGAVGESGASLAALETALLDGFGPPEDGDATTATAEAVRALVEAGVLVAIDDPTDD